VLDDLWRSVRESLKPPYKTVANNFIADGDYVAIEAIGQNSTPGGKTYNNQYCWVCRIQQGKIHELKEYMDTDLVTKTFTPPPVKVVGQKFRVEFEMAKAILHFQSDTSLQFTITEKEGKPCQEAETVAIKLLQIRPDVYMASWKEKNLTTVTQVHDFNIWTIYSNWTSPGGELTSRVGRIVPMDSDN